MSTLTLYTIRDALIQEASPQQRSPSAHKIRFLRSTERRNRATMEGSCLRQSSSCSRLLTRAYGSSFFRKFEEEEGQDKTKRRQERKVQAEDNQQGQNTK